MTIPMPPEDPRRGNPNLPSTWIALGGLAIIIIVIGAITIGNGGGDGHSTAPSTTGPGPTTPATAPTGETSDIVYRIIFEGTGSAHTDMPNRGQDFRSADYKLTWHLEYMVGDGHTGLPDMTKSRVSGTGTSTNWNRADSCTATQVTIDQNQSGLRVVGGSGYSIYTFSPMNDGVTSSDCLNTPFTDPFSGAWGHPDCGDECSADDFWKVSFDIPAGQTGSHTKNIATRSFNNKGTEDAGPGSRSARATWSGSVTVISQ